MCSLVWAMCDDNLFFFRTKNSNDNCHSKICDSFNSKSKIKFYDGNPVFNESYSIIVDSSSCLFDDKNDEKYLWKLSSSFLDF